MGSQLDREKIVKNLFNKKSSKQILLQGLKELIPQKGTYLETIIIGILAIIISIAVGVSESTVIMIRDIIELINNVMLAIFGIVFTGYALFQALVDTALLKRLMTVESNGKPFFSISNDYFVRVMIVNSLAIFINVILLILTKIIPDYWYAFDSNLVNNSIASILIFIYLYFELMNIWEIKSFVFNVYQLFNINAGEKMINIMNDEENEESQ